jgi:DNA invertase Pin-like site-specific DNA recombinase
MARLKTQAQLEQERLQLARYSFGKEVQLDRSRLLCIYCRQSTDRQYFKSDKNNTQQRSELEETAYTALQWPRELVSIRIENDVTHKQGATSGRKSIAYRPVLDSIYRDVKAGLVGAVLVVDVSRLSRDIDLIDPTMFAQACKRSDTAIVTSADSYIYDFNHPTKDDLKKFTDEAYDAARFIERHVKGKMLKARTVKANSGLLGSGQAPIGMQVDDTRNALVASVHASQVDMLYARYRALDANLTALFKEIVAMTKQGIALFPYDASIDPKSIHLDLLDKNDITKGWTIKSRYGLRYLLSNPMYAGHLVFNNRVVKKNTHPPIVDLDNWQYAFDHIADVTLDGEIVERESKAVRYNQTGNSNNALLSGTRDNGALTVDGINGAHVYYNSQMKAYLLLNRQVPTVYGFETSISAKELDAIVTERLLHWCSVSEKYTGITPNSAMDKLPVATPIASIPDDLELSQIELAKVQRALQFQDSMSDARLEETLAKEKRLIKRIANLTEAQNDSERIARQQTQGKEDILTANAKWDKWTIEKRRSFVRLVTDSITLEDIASGWIKITFVWSPILGFIQPMASNTRARDTAYLWRQSGSRWSTEETDILTAMYANSTRQAILQALPTRSWASIIGKAGKLGIVRGYTKHESDSIPIEMSLTDVKVINARGLTGQRVQWVHDVLVSNSAIIS